MYAGMYCKSTLSLSFIYLYNILLLQIVKQWLDWLDWPQLCREPHSHTVVMQNMLESTVNKTQGRNRCEDCGSCRRFKFKKKIVLNIKRAFKMQLIRIENILAFRSVECSSCCLQFPLVEIRNVWRNSSQIADNCLIPWYCWCWPIWVFTVQLSEL